MEDVVVAPSVASAHSAGDAARRNALTIAGRPDGVPLIFAHGFGTDQRMWRHLTPALSDAHPIITFDHVGSGRSDFGAYDAGRYATLRGYADDVVELVDESGLDRPVFIGHSAGGMIGLLASLQRPKAFRAIVLIGASPRYVDDDGYVGGFSREDIDGVLSAMQANWQLWGETMAPVVMANPERPELAKELQASFARFEAEIAYQFARAIFLSDYRAELGRVDVPTLVLQSTADPMVPPDVGDYLHANLRNSEFVTLDATGHFPQMSASQETARAITRFVDALA